MVHFVKEDVIQHAKKLWTINVQDKEVQRPLKEIIVGESKQVMLSSLSEPDRTKFMIKVELLILYIHYLCISEEWVYFVDTILIEKKL